MGSHTGRLREKLAALCMPWDGEEGGDWRPDTVMLGPGCVELGAVAVGSQSSLLAGQ